MGDLLCSPLDYFDFPCEAEKVCCTSAYRSHIDKTTLVIYGGGGLIHLPAPDYNNGVMGYLDELCEIDAPKVSWGVGHNIHGTQKIEYPQNFIDSFVLHGVRDFRQNDLPWVPCASCMHHAFDRPYEIKRDIVATGHGLDRYPTIERIETKIDVCKATPEEVIRAIGESELVVTNAYHSAYWALLLQRRVVVFHPLSSKFYGLPQWAVLAAPSTWTGAAEFTAWSPGFLETCRKKNQMHYEKILEMT